MTDLSYALRDALATTAVAPSKTAAWAAVFDHGGITPAERLT
jgi:hypothetical protein